MKALSCTMAAAFLFALGCGGRGGPTKAAPVVAGRAQMALPDSTLQVPAVEPAPEFITDADGEPQARMVPGALAQGGAGQVKGGEKPPAQKVARKIKQSAELKLITDEFEKTRDEVQRLIVKHDGYEAQADVKSSPGAQRIGTWRVRVPIENFNAFRQEIRKLVEAKLAEVESDTVNAEDLTEQYYDLEANIKNLRAEQESWREMLKRTSDKLESMITVKRELDRVTDEIQRKEGKLRLMANLTDLTTINLTLRERQKFTPEKGPEIVEAADFGMRAGKTFDDSWGALRSFGQGVALIAIALAPWLPLILLVAIPTWIVVRRTYRAIPSAAAPAASHQV